MSRPPPHERPTPQQLQSGGSSDYICPRCGAHEWRGGKRSTVESTRHPDGRVTIRRRRLCQCGEHAFVTEETVVPEGHKLKIVPEDEEEEVAA